MASGLPVSRSQGNLIVERHYMPRSKSYTFDEQEASNPRPLPRNHTAPGAPTEQPSPRGSVDSYSPGNGYIADHSISEVSSVAGSVNSFANKMYPNSRYNTESGDSGNYSGRQNRFPSSATSYTTETDLDSVTSSRYNYRDDVDRYKGELFQPQQQQPAPAPRAGIEQRQVRQMYGEVHPRNLPSEELPTPSSADELESAASEFSVPSFADVPRARPRASMRKKSENNSAFVSDDELSSVTSAADKLKGILKNNNTDFSDAESLAKSNFQRSNSRRSVRFQHRDKATDLPKKVTDYSELDNPDTQKKRKKSNSSDPFAHVSAIGIKPARNDPKRSSTRSNSSRGSQSGKKARSSSSDRSRQTSRQGSVNRSRSASADKSSKNQSSDRKGSRDRSVSPNNKKRNGTATVSVKGDDVTIDMPSSKPEPSKRNTSIMGEIVSQPKPGPHDKQKMCKWCLIVGVPLVVLLVVAGVIAGVMIGR